mmetsp:Transcript_41003/g.80882  ORF Transcript_41003/g.80882 Transcript_41003/m.80882 type:complete len:110 (-) Transcript_41003:469-798(-)
MSFYDLFVVYDSVCVYVSVYSCCREKSAEQAPFFSLNKKERHRKAPPLAAATHLSRKRENTRKEGRKERERTACCRAPPFPTIAPLPTAPSTHAVLREITHPICPTTAN